MPHRPARHAKPWLDKLTLPEFLIARLPGLRPRGPRRVLAVETDGFVTRAAVVRAEQNQLSVEQVAHSSAPTLAAALDETLAALRQSSDGLPTSAIFLTPGVLPALLELPVNPEQPRPSTHMQELMRWELDPLFAQHASVWTLETVLVGRGYLTYSQVHELSEEIERRKQAHLPPIRIGELALERGLLTRQQLDECRAIQEWLQATDEDLVCGWSPQPGTGLAEAETFPWLACGVGRRQRARWVEMFSRRHLQLVALYPLMGCSSAVLNGASAESGCAILEVRTGQLMVARLAHGGIREFRLHYTDGQPPTPKSVSRLLPPDIPDLWIAGREREVPLLTDAIRHGLGRVAQPVPLNAAQLPANVSPTTLAPLLGASRHALGLPGGSRIAAVPARDPGPPLWQRVEVWAIGIGLLALVLIVGVETSMSVKKRDLQAQTAKLRENLGIIQAEIDRINERIADLSQVEKAIETKQEELARLERRLRLLEVDIPQREAFIPALLDAVAGAVTTEVAIDQIIESERGSITVNGWALTEKAAQQFAQALSISMDQWQRAIAEFRVWEQEGRLGLPGFALSLQVVPTASSREESP